MTILDSVWLTPAEYRVSLGLDPAPLVADVGGVKIDSLGRRWDPRDHPRGRDGRFIEVGGLVKFFESLNGRQVAGTGVVESIDGDNISVRVQHVDTNAPGASSYRVNGVSTFNKRQIATVPPNEVRLDRRGNVHPDDRELPDKDGKLIRRGDRVRANGHEGTVILVGEDGRVAIRRDDGQVSARRVEHVERLDHPNHAAVRPHEREHHDRHAARLDRGAAPAEPVAAPAPPVAQDFKDHEGNDLPDGWTARAQPMGPGNQRIIVTPDVRPPDAANGVRYSVLRDGDGNYRAWAIGPIPRRGQQVRRDLGTHRTYESVKAALERDRQAHLPRAEPDAPLGHVVYTPLGGGPDRRVRVTNRSDDIKDGRPGFEGVVVGGPDDGQEVWGYDDQIVREEPPVGARLDGGHRGLRSPEVPKLFPDGAPKVGTKDRAPAGWVEEKQPAGIGVINGSQTRRWRSKDGKYVVEHKTNFRGEGKYTLLDDKGNVVGTGDGWNDVKSIAEREDARPTDVGGDQNRDSHGNAVPDGWEKSEVAGREVWTKDNYRVTPVEDPRYPNNPKRLRVDRLGPDGNVVEQGVGYPDRWEPDPQRERVSSVESVIASNEAERGEIHRLGREDAVRRLQPTREQLAADLERFGAGDATVDAARHGSDDELKEAIASDKNLQDKLSEVARQAMGRNIRQGHQRDEEDAAERVRNAQRHGARDEPLARPEPTPDTGPSTDVPGDSDVRAQAVSDLRKAAAEIDSILEPIEDDLGDMPDHIRDAFLSAERSISGVADDLEDGVITRDQAVARLRTIHDSMDEAADDLLDRSIPGDVQQDAQHAADYLDEVINGLNRPQPRARLTPTPEPSAPSPPQTPETGPDATPDVDTPWDGQREGYTRHVTPLGGSVTYTSPDGYRIMGTNDGNAWSAFGPDNALVGELRYDTFDEAHAAVEEHRAQNGPAEPGRPWNGDRTGYTARQGMGGASVAYKSDDGAYRILGTDYGARWGVYRNDDNLTQVGGLFRSFEEAHAAAEADRANIRANAPDGSLMPPGPPAPRVPLMQPGVRGRGQFADAVIRNSRGDDLRVGVRAKLPDGREGYIVRVHPPSNRVVVENPVTGLHVMRDVDRVRAIYPPDAPAVPNAPEAPAPDAPHAPDAPGALPGFDAVLNLRLDALRELREELPRRGPVGAQRQVRNAGFALDDALDTSKSPNERQRALDRAIFLLSQAVDNGHPGARRLLVRLGEIRREQLEVARGDADKPKVAGTPEFPRVGDARPDDLEARDPGARPEDYAQVWGYERGVAIARAARERPSIQAFFDAPDEDDSRLEVAKRIFNGTYGDAGLRFEVLGAFDNSVTGRIVTPDGRRVGTFERWIRNDGTVYNAYLKIEDEKLRGGGAATEFNTHMEDWYIANGFTHIDVSPDLENGRFVWARTGFDWRPGTEGSARAYARSILAAARRRGDADVIREAEEMERRANLDPTHPDFPTPYDLSAVGERPGMTRKETWVGKEVMMDSGRWSGRKVLSPDARTYKQLVARGKAPDPNKKDPPRKSQYTHADMPDTLRAVTIEDLKRVAPQGGNRGELEHYFVKQTGGIGGAGEGDGVNKTWILTAKDGSGRQFIIKQDTLAGRAGAENEVNYAAVLRALDYYGASYVERGRDNDDVIISTFVGEQNGVTKRTIIGSERRSPDTIAANLADPGELLVARIMNAITQNSDRHQGNAMWGEDADGKLHLLLFDHGLANHSRRDRHTALEQLSGERCAYLSVLKVVMRGLGRDATTTMVQERANELLQKLQQMRFVPSDNRRLVMIGRLQEIINNPGMVYDWTIHRY